MNSLTPQATGKILVTVEIYLQDYQAIQSLIQEDDPERDAIPQAVSQIVRGWQAASLAHYELLNGGERVLELG